MCNYLSMPVLTFKMLRKRTHAFIKSFSKFMHLLSNFPYDISTKVPSIYPVEYRKWCDGTYHVTVARSCFKIFISPWYLAGGLATISRLRVFFFCKIVKWCHIVWWNDPQFTILQICMVIQWERGIKYYYSAYYYSAYSLYFLSSYCPVYRAFDLGLAVSVPLPIVTGIFVLLWFQSRLT